MSESRQFIYDQVERVQRGGSPGSAPPSDEEQRYAAGADDQVDDQDVDQDEGDFAADGQQAGEAIELPDTWPTAFWQALTPEAQAEFERGDHSLVPEWQMWASGQVDAGSVDAGPPEAPVDLPPSADEAAAYGQQWLQLAHAGGDEENTAGDCFEQAQAWSNIARSAAIAEVQVGRRQSWDLSDEDQAVVLQAEIDRRVQAGREKWGSD